MITLITGVPGSGKTSALVELLMDLAEGRALFVNGIPDLKVPHVDLDEPRKWHELVPDGSAIVIDEVQRVWRPDRSKVPEDIAALETHRHRGIDFFIVTQNPKLVHASVRALVGRHVHLRDTGVTGRWWYEWTECCDALTFKQAPVKKKYNMSKKAQKLYTSASMHIKPIRAIPRSLLIMLAAIPIAGFLGSKVYAKIDSVIHPQAQHSALTAKGGRAGDLSREPASGSASTAAPASQAVTYRAGQVVEPPNSPEGDPVGAIEPAPAKPKGCIASRDRCRCFDDAGMLLDLEPERCREAIGVAGKVLPLDAVPLTQRAPDFGPAGRHVDPVPMAELRRQSEEAVHDRAPGERKTQAWQAPIVRDIERM